MKPQTKNGHSLVICHSRATRHSRAGGNPSLRPSSPLQVSIEAKDVQKLYRLGTLLLVIVCLTFCASISIADRPAADAETMIEQNNISPLIEQLDQADEILADTTVIFDHMETYSGWAKSLAGQESQQSLNQIDQQLNNCQTMADALNDHLDTYLQDDWIERFEITGLYSAVQAQRARLTEQERLYCYYHAVYQTNAPPPLQEPNAVSHTQYILETQLNTLFDELAYFGRQDQQMSQQMLWVVRFSRMLTHYQPRAIDIAKQTITQMLPLQLPPQTAFELRYEILRCNLMHSQTETLAWLAQWDGVRQWLLQQDWPEGKLPQHLLRLTLLREIARKAHSGIDRPITEQGLIELEQLWNTLPSLRGAIESLTAWPYMQQIENNATNNPPEYEFEFWCLGRQLQDVQNRYGLAAQLWQQYQRQFTLMPRHYQDSLFDLAFCQYQLAQDSSDKTAKTELLANAIGNWLTLARDFANWQSAIQPQLRNANQAAILAAATAYNLSTQQGDQFTTLAQNALMLLVGNIDMQNRELIGPYTSLAESGQYRFYLGMVLLQLADYQNSQIVFDLVPQDDQYKLTARYYAIYCAYAMAKQTETMPANGWQNELNTIIQQIENTADPDEHLLTQCTLLLARLHLDAETPQASLDILRQYEPYWSNMPGLAEQGLWLAAEAYKTLGDNQQAWHILNSYYPNATLDQNQLLGLNAWLADWARQLRAAFAADDTDQLQNFTDGQLLTLTSQHLQNIQTQYSTGQLSDTLHQTTCRIAAEIYSWHILTQPDSQTADQLKQLLDYCQRHNIADESLWTMRAKAALAMAQENYDQARIHWRTIRLGLEQSADPQANDLWWEARILSLYCLKAQSQPRQLAHVIDVTLASENDQPGQWQTRLGQLQTWASESAQPNQNDN